MLMKESVIRNDKSFIRSHIKFMSMDLCLGSFFASTLHEDVNRQCPWQENIRG
jgi:hypothetical protein